MNFNSMLKDELVLAFVEAMISVLRSILVEANLGEWAYYSLVDDNYQEMIIKDGIEKLYTQGHVYVQLYTKTHMPCAIRCVIYDGYTAIGDNEGLGIEELVTIAQ